MDALHAILEPALEAAVPAAISRQVDAEQGASRLAATRSTRRARAAPPPAPQVVEACVSDQSPCGLVVDLGAFLAQPTLSALCRLLRRPSPTTTRPSVLVGPQTYRGYVLLIPGRTGMALGMYPIAEALRRCMPPDTAVVLVDLKAIAVQAPQPGLRAYLRAELLQVVRDLGVDHLRAVAGHSVGGLFGADLLQALEADERRSIPLVMLDTYAPRILRADRPYRLKRGLVALATCPWQTIDYWVAKRRNGNREAGVEHATGRGADAMPWSVITREMLDGRTPWPGVRVVLLQARRSRFRAGLLRYRATNGFDPAAFASFAVVALDTAHKEMRGKDADMTARVIAAVLRDGGVGAGAA